MIEAYTNDKTLLVRDHFSLRCHEPLPIPCDEIDIADFFNRWDMLTNNAFLELPPFIRDSFEVRALSKILTNDHFKQTAKKFVDYHGGVRQGLLSMMESELISFMPTTAKQEFFAFTQYAISPYSHLYLDCNAIVLKNANLMDMLLIGHHQFDVIVFDRALIESHAVSFALKLGLSVVITTAPLPFSNHKQTMQLSEATLETRQSVNKVSLPVKITLNVKGHSQTQQEEAIHG